VAIMASGICLELITSGNRTSRWGNLMYNVKMSLKESRHVQCVAGPAQKSGQSE
jgi:hypothetical protein